MEVGLPTAVPDTAQRQQAPAIDDRPAATVEPVEPKSRNEATGRRRDDREQRQPDRPDRPDRAETPNRRLSDSAARAVTEAAAERAEARAEAADADDKEARVARERAVQAYAETVLRASTARPSLDLTGGSGGGEPATEASASA